MIKAVDAQVILGDFVQKTPFLALYGRVLDKNRLRPAKQLQHTEDGKGGAGSGIGFLCFALQGVLDVLSMVLLGLQGGVDAIAEIPDKVPGGVIRRGESDLQPLPITDEIRLFLKWVAPPPDGIVAHLIHEIEDHLLVDAFIQKPRREIELVLNGVGHGDPSSCRFFYFNTAKGEKAGVMDAFLLGPACGCRSGPGGKGSG